MEFTITDGMEEVLHLKMRNYSTMADICKIKDGTNTLLAGARLRLIRKDSGEIIQEWTSEESGGRRFHGLVVIDEIEEKPDFIVLDPPRDGIHPKALPKIRDSFRCESWALGRRRSS